MTDRHATLRRLYAEGGLGDVASHDFHHEGDHLLGLRPLREAFFPDLRVEVVELLDASGDRVLARIVMHLGAGRTSYEAVQVWRFRGDEIVGVWSMHDPLPWLQELGVVPDDAEIERRLDARVDGG